MKYFKLIAVIVIAVSISGCAVLGITSWQLRHQGMKYSNVFDKDMAYCYQAAKDGIAKWKAEVWYERKGRYILAWKFNTVYKNCIDTTELGIFFKEEGPGKTRVEVSSLNRDLSEYVSERLFRYISNPQASDEKQ